jgi:hypothetical protein
MVDVFAEKKVASVINVELYEAGPSERWLVPSVSIVNIIYYLMIQCIWETKIGLWMDRFLLHLEYKLSGSRSVYSLVFYIWLLFFSAPLPDHQQSPPHLLTSFKGMKGGLLKTPTIMIGSIRSSVFRAFSGNLVIIFFVSIYYWADIDKNGHVFRRSPLKNKIMK